jgi:hypothetical protein
MLSEEVLAPMWSMLANLETRVFREEDSEADAGEVSLVAMQERSSAVILFDGHPPFLAALVDRYQVCWEVAPGYSTIGGQERPTGFELELSGTHESATQHMGRGCPACRRIYSALHAVTEWVLPRQADPSMYQIGPYKVVLRYSAVHGSGFNGTLSVKIDVALKVKVFQLRGFDQSVGQCEIRSLRETKEKLSELGTGERQWSLRTQRWHERVRELLPGSRQYGAAFALSHLDV